MSSISLTIRILDKDYQVNCKPDERDALILSASLLDEKMEEIRRSSHIIGVERIAVMAALNLAHDLIRSEQSAQAGTEASHLLQSMNSKLSSALSDLNS
ncbi:Z ring-associated protein ZapA [Gammaproteobacteria bacterium MOLA455]|nr:Z ring-associated protein ZapA [Gammaproteobacteria bacterium MOLA455]